MKKVTRVLTVDGKLFESEKRAELHEAEFLEVQALERSIFPAKFDTCDFGNGGGYIQLSPDAYERFMAGYRKVIAKYHKELLRHFDKYPTGIIGRYLGDGDAVAYSLWCLACQIDDSGRLWGQSYYTAHQNEAEQKMLFEIKK